MDAFVDKQLGQLQQLINREVVCLEQLHEVLQQEHVALVATDLEDIKRTSSDKHSIISALEQSMDTRNTWLSTSGLDIDHEELESSLNKICSGNSALTDLARKLESLSAHCRDANISNGMLILKKEQITRRALNTLRPNISAATYSDKGQTSLNNCRSLGKA